jgi:hypothetical protein
MANNPKQGQQQAGQQQPGQQQPGQQQPGQAAQQATQQAKQKLQAAGCPAQHCDQLAAQLPSDAHDQLAKLARLPGVTLNWGVLMQLLAQYGPQIIAQLVNLFGQNGGGSQPGPGGVSP